MTAQGALTEQDVLAAREEVAAGRSVTLWFTAAAVGVPAGGSAKVVAVGEPAEGDFIQVRPAGSRDTLFCSPNELTRTRPARRRKTPETREPSTGPAEKASRPVASAAEPIEPATPAERPAAPARPRTGAGSRSRADRSADRAERAERAEKPRQPRAEKAETTVSLTATADGEWSAEVRVGRKLVMPPVSVQAADVAAAARSLPPAVAEVITSSLERARHRQRERVEQLRAELDAAQRTLEQLGD